MRSLFFRSRKMLLAFAAFLIFAESSFAADEALVFYPSIIPVKEREAVLKSELGGVTVFGRVKDFLDAVKQRNPKMFIGPPSLSRAMNNYKPAARFHQNGKPQVKYAVVSLTKQWTAKNLSTGKMGVIEETDREFLKPYFGTVLTFQPASVKSVSKPEDLFPLLVFKSVDYIVLHETILEQLQKQFSVKTFVVQNSAPTDAVQVYVRDGEEAELLEKVLKMGQPALNKLGFSKIESLGEKK